MTLRAATITFTNIFLFKASRKHDATQSLPTLATSGIARRAVSRRRILRRYPLFNYFQLTADITLPPFSLRDHGRAVVFALRRRASRRAIFDRLFIIRATLAITGMSRRYFSTSTRVARAEPCSRIHAELASDMPLDFSRQHVWPMSLARSSDMPQAVASASRHRIPSCYT